MNKKLLLLAGILAVSATTMAAEEGTTAPAFKPTGSWEASAKFKTNKFYSKKGSMDKTKVAHDRMVTIENEASVMVTEKLELYIDDVKNLNYMGRDEGKGGESKIRLNYYNGTIGAGDVSFQQRLEFNRTDSDLFRYQPRINFASYIGGTEGFFALNLDHVRYDGAAAYRSDDALGFDTEGKWDLGAGFTFDAELSGNFVKKAYDGASRKKKDTLDTVHDAELDLGVKYDLNLYSSASDSIAFYAELYNKTAVAKGEKRTGMKYTQKEDKLTSEIYVKLNHKLNSASSIYLKPGIEGEYGLYTNEKNSDLKSDYKRGHMNAYVTLGLKVTL